ncbi:hypothetical protein [Pseudoalteromonas sp. R3]|uniref:hypothetical protein n=1 Tax=Pseudoalteromonas sp. R3 TaxID=1709477 RepID=UPI0006B681D4|nr:hypothetical protein [Pseudoalteromonas sp. R3]AZZ95942.1 hypothetical protein ELR70_01695 [Pseudoalteromonas sp. R3]
MTVNEDIARQLHKLLTQSESVLSLYYDKQSWPKIDVTLAQLAEQYTCLYRQAPNALHAHLHFVATPYRHSTNVLVKQSILLCMLGYAHGYTEHMIHELLVASFASVLCASREYDKVASDKPLSNIESKKLRLRHQLAVKVLSAGQIQSPQVTRILARLSSYELSISRKRATPLYDNVTLLVAIATQISVALMKKSQRASLPAVIKQLYLNNTHTFLQTSLQLLARQLDAYPAGAVQRHPDHQALLLCEEENHAILAIMQSGKITRLIKTQRRYQQRYHMLKASDSQLLYRVWSRIPPQPLATSSDQMTEALHVVEQLGGANFGSFRAIEKTIAPFPEIETALAQAARLYNREAQKGANLRHCLTMVGLDAAALLCQRVLVEQLIVQLKHPFAKDIWHKYQLFAQVLAALVQQNYGHHYENILSPVSAAVAFMLKRHSVDIKRFPFALDSTDSTHPVSLAQLFGFGAFSEEEFKHYFHNHFASSEAHRAFEQSELSRKSKLSGLALTFTAVKILTLLICDSNFKTSAWQRQVLEEQARLHDWTNLDTLMTHLQSIGLYNLID